jgi:protein-disulfide isomerase
LKNKTTWILAVLLAVAAFLAVTFWTRLQSLEGEKGAKEVGEVAKQEEAGSVEALKAEEHLRGDQEARILLIEYSDLECPFCRRFHLTAKQAVDNFDGQVAWVYRHFPLDQLHSKARKEAEATECAAELGGNEGFWKLTDKIYEVTPGNNGLDLETLPDLAEQVGLERTGFEECLDSGRQAQLVEEDYQSGLKAGIRGTPGIILFDTQTGETRSVPGAVPFEQLKQEIESLLQAS